jgi:hypothetical protein
MGAYLLPSKSRLVTLLGFKLVNVLVECDLSIGDRLDGLDAHVTSSDSIGILPAPSGAHSGVLKGFLKDGYAVLL